MAELSAEARELVEALARSKVDDAPPDYWPWRPMRQMAEMLLALDNRVAALERELRGD